MLSESDISRFWSKVDITDDCWEWTACKTSFGYGQLGIDGIMTNAHRISWEISNGPIPDGMVICHKCDNPGCVNPDHLFAGTHKDNIADCISRGMRGCTGFRGARNALAT